MRKITNAFCLGVLAIIAIALLMKLIHIEVAGILLMWGHALLSLIVIPIFFIRRIRNSEAGLAKASNVVSFIAVFFISNGIFFKTQHWPASSYILTLGMGISFFAILIYTVAQILDKNSEKFEMPKTIFVALLFGLYITIFNSSFTASLLNDYTVLGKEQLETIEIIKEEIEAQKLASSNSYIKEADLACNSTIRKITDLKHELLNNKVKDKALLEIEEISQTNNIESRDRVNALLVGPIVSLSNKPSKGEQLYADLQLLKTQLLGIVAKMPTKNPALEKLILTDIQLDSSDSGSEWVQTQFEGKPLIAAYVNLIAIEHSIYNAQLAINQIALNGK